MNRSLANSSKCPTRILVQSLLPAVFLALWPAAGFAALSDLYVLDRETCSKAEDVTVDTIGSQEWLDVDLTDGLSWNDLTGPAHDCNPTCSTGPFAGWTFAGQWDVIALLNHAGLAIGENNGAIYDGFGSRLGIPSDSRKKYLTRDLASADQAVALEFDNVTICGIYFCSTPWDIGTTSISVADGVAPHGAWLYRWNFGPFPYADFDLCPATGPVPLTVELRDQSVGAESWSWDLGDGSTSVERNPAHKFAALGSYPVELTIGGSGGSDQHRDNVTTTVPRFADVANSAVRANTEFGYLVTQFWRSTVYPGRLHPAVPDFGEAAYGHSDDAWKRAGLALSPSSSWWGGLALAYAEQERALREQALAYFALGAAASGAMDYDTANYYFAYGLSLNATADLYNGSVILTAGVESGIESLGMPSILPAAPSFLTTAYTGLLSNLYLSTAIAYSIYVLNDPSYYPLVALNAQASLAFAQQAYDEAVLAAAARPGFWADCVVDSSFAALGATTYAVFYFDAAVDSWGSGDSTVARSHLVEAYAGGWLGGAGPADYFNGSMIWCASQASEGGRY